MQNVAKIVAHPVTGQVFTESSKNPGWGVIRVDSNQVVMSNGIMDIQKRTAFVRMKTEIFKALDFKAGQIMPGKIRRMESFAPFYEGQPAKINPTTKELVLTNGQPTYLQFEYVDDAKAQDLFITEDAEVEATTDASQML